MYYAELKEGRRKRIKRQTFEEYLNEPPESRRRDERILLPKNSNYVVEKS